MDHAFISDDGLYRYSLTRDLPPRLGEGEGYSMTICTFVMLNPSTADADRDDPTIRRCIRFARDWGFTQLKVVNLYAYRATDPSALYGDHDAVGPENDCTIAKVVGGSDLVFCAWGSHDATHGRDRLVLDLIGAPHSLGLTLHGSPRHPLYVRADTRPLPFAHCPWQMA